MYFGKFGLLPARKELPDEKTCLEVTHKHEVDFKEESISLMVQLPHAHSTTTRDSFSWGEKAVMKERKEEVMVSGNPNQ